MLSFKQYPYSFLLHMVLTLLCCTGMALAQPADNLRHRFGITAGLSLNFHSADFKKLPNVINCCPQFDGGSGSGFLIGFLYDLPLSKRFALGTRLSYIQQGATLSATENTDVWNQQFNITSVASINHSIATSLSTIGIEPMVNYNPGGTFRFHAGMRFAMLSSIHYDQHEEMTTDGYVFKENGFRTRNEFSGTITSVQSLQSAVLLGASIEFPLNKARTTLLVPEVFYQIGSSNLTPDISWQANALRLSMALKFSTTSMLPDTMPSLPPQKEAPVIAKETKAVQPDTAHTTVLSNTNHKESESATQISLRVVAVNENQSEMPFSTIRSEEFIATQLKPLLGYVFFENASDSLPVRYKKFNTAKEASTFSTASIDKEQELTIYYNLLNIVGSRMKENPSATLTLTGCNTDVGLEKNNTELSRRRAETIKRYLLRNFGIAEKRFIISARNLPARPSRSSDENINAADEENRRVELSSSMPEILAPLLAHDTMNIISPHLLRFKPQTENLSSKMWDMDISGSKQVLFTKNGKGSIPTSIDWSPLSIQKADTLLSATITATATDGSTASSNTLLLPVQHVTLRGKQQQNLRDKSIEQYRLILFDFDQSELSAANKRIVDIVRTAVKPNSEIHIEGFSDELGDDRYNNTLSEERARTTAKVLGTTAARITAHGESSYFNNNVPEGRFYNRTVLITIATPR